MSEGADAVDRYLEALGEPHRRTLEAVRASLRRILPHADEGVKYGMPALLVEGRAVAGYAAFKAHCGYYPMSGTVLERAGDAVAGYRVSKGALRFPPDQPLPEALLRRLVALRLEELEAAPEA